MIALRRTIQEVRKLLIYLCLPLDVVACVKPCKCKELYAEFLGENASLVGKLGIENNVGGQLLFLETKKAMLFLNTRQLTE